MNSIEEIPDLRKLKKQSAAKYLKNAVQSKRKIQLKLKYLHRLL